MKRKTTRNHVWSRNSTFTSEEAPHPIAAGELQSTNGLTLRNGSRQVFVNSKQTYSIGKDQWVGKTLFPLTKEAAHSRRLPYAGDLKDKLNNRWTLRCRGHIWAAVTPPKKKPTPSNVDEKKLSWEDRLAFVEGKKSELSSIFENGVWEVELHPHRHKVAPDRIFRARWVLAWRTGAGGEQRAKARLVLQGFNDPDLLEGKLETSSPTLCRTARQTLLAIACNENWEKWVSDVATVSPTLGKASP